MESVYYLEPQRLTSVNVKVRRLGYLLAIVDILYRNELPERVLADKLCDWSDDHSSSLRQFCVKLNVTRSRGTAITGQIKTPLAATRYLRAAEEMGFVVRTKQAYMNTKTGDVLWKLPGSGNPFLLSSAQKHLILRQILIRDHDYLKALISVAGRAAEPQEWREFVGRLLQIWRTKADIALRLSPERLEEIREAVRSVEGWKKNPTRYYREDIRATRLEWLLDLGLLRGWNQKHNGLILIPNMEELLGHGILRHDWLDTAYTPIFSRVCNPRQVNSEWQALEESKRDMILVQMLDDAIDAFCPFAGIGKTSADQFLDFAASSLVQEGIVATHEELERGLIDMLASNPSFRYVRTRSQADRGFIIKSSHD